MVVVSSSRVDCTLSLFNDSKISSRPKTDWSVSLTVKYSKVIQLTCLSGGQCFFFFATLLLKSPLMRVLRPPPFFESKASKFVCNLAQEILFDVSSSTINFADSISFIQILASRSWSSGSPSQEFHISCPWQPGSSLSEGPPILLAIGRLAPEETPLLKFPGLIPNFPNPPCSELKFVTNRSSSSTGTVELLGVACGSPELKDLLRRTLLHTF